MELQLISHVTGAIPTLHHGVQSARQFRARAARCAQSWRKFARRRTRSSIDIGEGPRSAIRRLRSSSAAVTSDISIDSCAGSCADGMLGSRPRIGSIAAITSPASVTGVASCFSKPFVPSLRGSSGEPGTAKTSRPCSPASRAVISDPERRAASTTTTPSERPEISRLRRGKSCARGSR